MRPEGFFHRWSRLKVERCPDRPAAARPAALPPAAAEADGAAQPRLPTMNDVALLGADSDYSAFVAQGVDKAVQRQAMKKLFSDPHFHVMDGLDIYMGDYNRPDPVSAAMLAALGHAASFFAQATAVEAKESAAAPDGAGGDPDGTTA
jgi:hypothetical protein